MQKNSNISTKWHYYLVCAQPDMPKVPKIGSLHIFVISLEKHGK